MPISSADFRHQGFTLLELLVVLAVLALTAVWVGPRIMRGEAAQIRAAIEIARAELELSRIKALSHRRPVTLWFDLSRRMIGERQVPGDFPIRLDTARELVTADGRGSIRFFSDGASSGGRLRFGDQGAGLDIDWLTGVVDAAP